MRIVVLVIIILSIWLSIQLVLLLISLITGDNPPDYDGVIAWTVGIPLGLALAWVLEKWLKRIWRSGNQITLGQAAEQPVVHFRKKDGEERSFYLGENLTLLSWYFQLQGYARGGRERRVANNWYCLSSQLQQDEQRLIVFTFVSPKTTAVLTEDVDEKGTFHQIQPKEVYERKLGRMRGPERPDIPPEVLRGSDGRLLAGRTTTLARGVGADPK